MCRSTVLSLPLQQGDHYCSGAECELRKMENQKDTGFFPYPKQTFQIKLTRIKKCFLVQY